MDANTALVEGSRFDFAPDCRSLTALSRAAAQILSRGREDGSPWAAGGLAEHSSAHRGEHETKKGKSGSQRPQASTSAPASGATPDGSLIGFKVRKEFPGHGVFHGSVTRINNGLYYEVIYEDGDKEEMEVDELKRYLLPDAAI